MIYADYNGSAPICKNVREYLIKRLNEGPYANPNAIHYLGQKVLMGMENARSICAKALGADFGQVIFNSGATEGITHAFYTVLEDNPKKTIITSEIEHSATANLCHYYKSKGYQLQYLPTLKNGIIDISLLADWIKNEDLAMVTIMACNNETGVLQPYEEVSALCNEYQVPFVCDTTQLIGKQEFHFKKSGADFAILSGHKLGALTGTGIMMAKIPSQVKPLIVGGGQEKGHRGGTQNYIGIETLAVALKDFEENLNKIETLNKKREEFEAKIKCSFPSVVIMGEGAPRLAGTTFISLPGVHGQAVQIELESKDIFVTTSSACSDNQPVTSKVLRAMGITDKVGRGVVRISLGNCSPIENYDTIYHALSEIYKKLSKLNSY